MTAAGIETARGDQSSDLARLMVGREVIFSLDKKPCQPGKVVLHVEDVQADNDKGLPALRGVSLKVRQGEIVGLAGVAGNGQRELADVITGLRKRHNRAQVTGWMVRILPIKSGRRPASAKGCRTSPRTAPTSARPQPEHHR